MTPSDDHERYPVRPELASAQREAWARLGRPGTWWSGEKRLAIAAECRAARSCELCRARKAALSPYGPPESHPSAGALAAPYVDAIHRLTTDPGRLTERWLDSLRAQGLEDERYVELVGVVITVVAMDVFHRALGLPRPVLPAPSPGEPSRQRPATARSGVAWVPLVAPEDGLADVYRGIPHVPLVRQALSLVPAELENLDAIEQSFYLPYPVIEDPAAPCPRAIARAQIELLAARVSFLNDCFY